MCQPKIKTWKKVLKSPKTILARIVPVLVISLIFTGSQAVADETPSPNPTTAEPTASVTAEPTPSETQTPTPSASPTATMEPKFLWINGEPYANLPKASPTFNPHAYSFTQGSSIWALVNKHRPLNPQTYVPANLKKPAFVAPKSKKVSKYQLNPYGYVLRKDAAAALVKMASAMDKAGKGNLILASAYRSYSSQKAIHANKVRILGKTAGENLAARPGFSEHQTGLAADLGAVGQGCYIRVCFATTKAGKWLAANSYKYGFILRYPNNLTSVHGYQFEPWHFRYVGVALATEMHNRGIAVFETFLGVENATKYDEQVPALPAWIY